MDDLISRQAAIDALHTWFRDGFNEDKWWNSTHVLAAIGGLPPAEPKRGKWVDMGKDPATGKWDTRLHIYCSECGHRSDDKPTKYCPNCGAKMEAADGND